MVRVASVETGGRHPDSSLECKKRVLLEEHEFERSFKILMISEVQPQISADRQISSPFDRKFLLAWSIPGL